MKWSKRGLIFSQDNAVEIGISNTQVPYGVRLGDRIRIFFGARKKEGGPAGIYYADVRSDAPKEIVYVSEQPIFASGIRGTFDQDGVLPVCIKKVDKEYYMYYGGFTKMVTHPHTCMMGLAISKDGCQSFERISEGPIFPINRIDPYLIGSADVVFNDGLWHMIYTSGTKWTEVNKSFEISYTLKYSYSKDGIDWTPTGQVVIPQETEFDAFAKPSIFRLRDEFVMCFSKRQIVNYREKGVSAYSLGLATSKDLVNWKRKDDQIGIEASAQGWDSEMICYPNIIDLDGRYLMLYNGNGFGKSGFGYAELEDY